MRRFTRRPYRYSSHSQRRLDAAPQHHQMALVFYYTYAEPGAEFWRIRSKQWAKDTEHFTNPSGTLRRRSSEIVSPADTEEQKARKIYAAVMKLDNTASPVRNRRPSARRRNSRHIRLPKMSGIRKAVRTTTSLCSMLRWAVLPV